MRNKKTFLLIFCCILATPHIMAMELSSSKEQCSDSPQRGRSPLRGSESQSRSSSAPAQQSKISSLSPEKSSKKYPRFSPRSSAHSSESESISPRQQQVDARPMNQIEVTPGNYLNPVKDIPLFRATEIKQIKDKIWKISYIDAGDQSMYLMDADKNHQSIHILTYMSPLDYSYWIKDGDDTFCIDLSLPKSVNEFFTDSVKMKSSDTVTEIKQTSDKIWQVSYNDEKNILQSVPVQIDQDETGFIWHRSAYWPQSKIDSNTSDITPKSTNKKAPNSKKSVTIVIPKIIYLSLLTAFVIAILYRENRLPYFSYYILAFNASLKALGTRS